VPIEARFHSLNDGVSIEEFLEWYPGVELGQVESVPKTQQVRLEEVLKRVRSALPFGKRVSARSIQYI